jgi:endonuclease/exonuclease/phosphatase family metal-dependent hydrolase
VRLLTYNIREGGVGRAEQIAEVIREASPDVVALQEARHPAVSSASRAGELPYWGARRLHSTGFLSRVPVMEHGWRHPPRTRHALLELSLGDGCPRVFVLHLRAWFSNWSEQRRARELRGLLDGIREQLVRERTRSRSTCSRATSTRSRPASCSTRRRCRRGSAGWSG